MTFFGKIEKLHSFQLHSNSLYPLVSQLDSLLFFSPTICTGRGCDDNCDQMWRFPTREDGHCLLFPLSVSVLLLLWASCIGQGSEQKPLRIPNQRNKIITSPFASGFFTTNLDILSWDCCTLFFLCTLSKLSMEKQIGTTTTHSLISSLQWVPSTNQACRVLSFIIQQKLV